MWITFPVQVEKKLWEKFRARVKKEGRTAKQVLYDFIEDYAKHGSKETKKKDDDQ